MEYPQSTLADSFLRLGAARLVAYPFRMRQSDGHSSRSRPNWRKINQRPLQWKKRKSKSKSVISESNRYSSDAGSATRTQLHQPPALSLVLKLISTHLSSQQPSRASSYHSAQSTLLYKQLCVNIQRQQVT